MSVDPILIMRAGGLYLPLCALALLWVWRRPDRRLRLGLLLGVSWNLVTLPLLHAVALWADWWHFYETGTGFLGMPLELYLGWAVLWGAVTQLAFTRLRPIIVLGMMGLVDLLAMPELSPLVDLRPGWFLGTLCGLALCLLPAWSLVHWTLDDVHVARRVTLQAVTFAGVALVLLPAAILSATGGTWSALYRWPGWSTGILIQVLIALALPGALAAVEFARHGGTPIPFDPPPRLITRGPYAYVANPMQLSVALLLVAWGGWLTSAWVAAVGPAVWLYAVGLADWSEGRDLSGRFGGEWRRYRDNVRSWLPRWRPWISDGATLYIAGNCERCSELRRWFERRTTCGLMIVQAELHPQRDLERITYSAGNGFREEEGIQALARGLEHIHLGWAVVGWAMRLPIFTGILQLLVDSAGGEARRVRRRVVDRRKPEPPGAGEACRHCDIESSLAN